MRLLTALAACALPAFAQTSLDDNVRAALAGFSGTVGIYAKNLDTGQSFGYQEDQRVRSASTIKLPIMMAVFDAVQRGRAHFTDLVLLSKRDMVDGAGILTDLSPGDRFPLRDLVHLMIVVSDGTATNLLLSRYSGDVVNALLVKLGFEQTRSLRQLLGIGRPKGFSAAGRLPENEHFGIGVTTPHEMVRLLEMLDRGQIVSPAASKEMIGIMKRQQDRNGIPRRLADMPVANKTGALDHLRSDVGIVYSPHGKIALAISCDEIPKVDYSSDNPALLLISQLTQILMDGLASP
jgi:beta-lactamase class A